MIASDLIGHTRLARWLGPAFLVAGCLAGWMLVSAVLAQTASAGVFTCRASVARLVAPALAKVEPIVANSAAGGQCYNDFSGLNDLQVGGGGSAGTLIVRGPTARTTYASPGGVPSSDAESDVAHVELADSKRRVVIGVDLVRSVEGSGSSCPSGRLAPTGFSHVANLRVNGIKLNTDGPLRLVNNLLKVLPTGQILKVAFDDVDHQGSASTQAESVTRDALHVVLRAPGGGVLLEAAVGESKVGRFGNPCEPNPPAMRWQCHGSLARVSIPNVAKLEPVVANSAAGAFCSPDWSGIRTLNADTKLADISLGTAWAQSSLDPLLAPTPQQTARGGAGVATLRIGVPSVGLSIGADAVGSQAIARCVNGAPVYRGRARVLSLTVNGMEITPDGVFQLVGNGVNGLPTGQTLRVYFDQEVTTSDPSTNSEHHTWRAVHLELLRSADGTPLVDVVLGESGVGGVLVSC